MLCKHIAGTPSQLKVPEQWEPKLERRGLLSDTGRVETPTRHDDIITPHYNLLHDKWRCYGDQRDFFSL